MLKSTVLAAGVLALAAGPALAGAGCGAGHRAPQTTAEAPLPQSTPVAQAAKRQAAEPRELAASTDAPTATAVAAATTATQE